MNAAPTGAADALDAKTNAPPPTTAAATMPPIALFLPLTLRRCVLLIACLPFAVRGVLGVRQHASEPETVNWGNRGGSYGS
ncbi:hypothetical protein GCM10010431_70810 [Streptomyces kunmingensis]